MCFGLSLCRGGNEKWLLKVYRVSVSHDLKHLELNSDGVLHYKCISYHRLTYFKIVKMENFMLYVIYYNCCLVTKSCTQGGIEPSSLALAGGLVTSEPPWEAHVTVIEKNKYNLILVSAVPSYFFFLPVYWIDWSQGKTFEDTGSKTDMFYEKMYLDSSKWGKITSNMSKFCDDMSD